MAEIPDVIPGDPIEATWGNPIRDRTVMRYDDAAARDLSVPIPVAGDLAFLADVGQITYFDGADWLGIPIGEFLAIAGGTMTGPIVQTPGGVVTAAPASGIQTTWFGDSTREYRWKRSSGFGDIELWAWDGATEVRVFAVDSSGNFEIYAAAFQRLIPTSATNAIRNIHRSTSDPGAGDGIDGDVWLTYS